MSVEFQLERDRAYRLLLDQILTNQIEAETPLSERKLADTLQIGRTPIREAIRDLVRDGVLEARPARGTFVRQLSLEDVREIYEVRYALEGMAAFLAAERGPTAALTAYGPRFREMMEHPDRIDAAAMYDCGAEFHLDVFRAARNRNLMQIYEPLRLRFRVALGLPRFYDHDRVHSSVPEHLTVLRAIESRDGQKAQQLMCDHLARGLDARMRIFESLREYRPPAANRRLARG
jgi:DNA-binding GntR family transcriptional regulator